MKLKSQGSLALVAIAALLLSLVQSNVAHASGKVTLLQSELASLRDWPSATRAVLAELALAGFEVTVKRVPASSVELLVAALEAETQGPEVVAAVFITRSQARGIGYVWLTRAGGPRKLLEDDPDAPIAQSTFALRLAEMLRDRGVHFPVERVSEPDTSQVREPEQRSPDDNRTQFAPEVWLGGIWAPGADAALVGGLGLYLSPLDWLELGFNIESSMSRLVVPSDAGSSSLGWLGGSVEASIAPIHSGSVQVAAGISCGALWMRSRATPDTDHIALDDAVTTAVLSLVLRAGYRRPSWGLELVLEPGALMPRVTIRSDQAPIESFGRPWLKLRLVASWRLP